MKVSVEEAAVVLTTTIAAIVGAATRGEVSAWRMGGQLMVEVEEFSDIELERCRWTTIGIAASTRMTYWQVRSNLGRGTYIRDSQNRIWVRESQS